MHTPLWMWSFFLAVILALLIFDLGVLNKNDREITIKQSLALSVFYIVIACLFGLFIGAKQGSLAATDYFTGFLIEKSLALDNIFVISLVFSYFSIPRRYQHRVLFWGILGVILLRGIMIFMGAAIVSRFAWVLHIFSVFLIYVGIKTFFIQEHTPDIANNKILVFLKKHLRITHELHGHSFLVKAPSRKNSHKIVYWATPLLIALLFIEAVDIVFAVDSIPAIFVITTDPFIVYTSNIFAILGLRALFFALSSIINRFQYLQNALGLVLIFIGAKIFIADWLELEKFPSLLSLGITFGLLASGVVFSLIKTSTTSK